MRRRALGAAALRLGAVVVSRVSVAAVIPTRAPLKGLSCGENNTRRKACVAGFMRNLPSLDALGFGRHLCKTLVRAPLMRALEKGMF